MTVNEFERLEAAPTGTLLEGPRWTASTSLLSWVDIPTGRLFLFDPDTDEITSHDTGVAPLGAALPHDDGSFDLMGPNAVYGWRPGEGSAVRRSAEKRILFAPHPSLISNDAGIDPWGRLYVGRMSANEAPGAGELLAVEPDGSTRAVARGLTIPNGLAWSADRAWMYVAESVERRVYRVPTGPSGEDWSRREVLIEHDSALPDGIVLGPDEHLWVACFGLGAVERYTLAGVRVASFKLPVSQATACEFVGGDLYVTTAAEGFREEDWAREPLAGSLFRLRAAVGA